MLMLQRKMQILQKQTAVHSSLPFDKPDGNCQFASLADQLKHRLNVNVNHECLRNATVQFLINEDGDAHMGAFVTEPWTKYLKKNGTVGNVWGSHHIDYSRTVVWCTNIRSVIHTECLAYT